MNELLRDRVAGYLRAHHTMTIATVALAGSEPHAAAVFYAMDCRLRLVFLSKPGSVHGRQIGAAGPVAVTVTEDYADWERIQGVQLWGVAELLSGVAKAGAFGLYVRRFPFVRELALRPGMTDLFRDIGVYRVTPRRVAFTDNTSGFFGREVLDLSAE